ncbi:MAG TPA: tyrosine-type recombinase/integrase [bacterium]|nr:tyrosine-type recombinase/integrase [bacterium]
MTSPEPSKNPQRPNPNLEDLRLVAPYGDFLALRKSSHTQENYLQDLRILRQFLQELGFNSPTQAKPEHLIRFAASLTKAGLTPSGKPRKAYSTRSMKRILAATRSFYRHLASIQAITNDPTAVFHNLNIRSPQRNPHPLTPGNRGLLIQNLRTRELADLKCSLTVLLGFHAGLRVSEIASLRLRDLDLAGGFLTVIGKGDKERTLPMTKPLLELLRKYLDARPEDEKGSPYLFASPRSAQKPIHPDYLETWVKQAAHWAQMENAEDLTVHVLRHSFGTQLAESGASAYEIRDLMGHSSITVSENYVKLASTRARQAHEKAFGNALRLPPPESDFGLLIKRFRKNPR